MTLDARNTVTVAPIILPAGFTFAYGPDVTGNPLNFQTTPSGVPEPGTYALVGLGMAVLAAKRRNRRA